MLVKTCLPLSLRFAWDAIDAVLDSQKGLKCDCCNSWLHTDCERVSDDVYQFLCDHEAEKSINWYCKHCTNVMGHLMLTAVGRIDEAQKRFESKFDSYELF